MNVLLVDDDDDVRDSLRPVVQSMGHKVNEAGDGEEALLRVQVSPIQVVISDWRMPRLDGIELVERVRAFKNGSYTYFILMTGASTGETEFRRAVRAGVDDFLKKPLDYQTLWSRLTVAERIIGLSLRLRQSEGFIPLCAYCKRIRNADDGYEPMETFIEKASGSSLSHGICPDCVEKVAQSK